MGLQKYRRKRDFGRTLEPEGAQIPARGNNKARSFVIQKHAARRLHYDFRLEMEGVLKSWAVPRGLPTRKGDKRLAVHVEDHPMEYAHFEGTIPQGEYGGGTVMVWDTGSYEAAGNPLQSLKAGKLHVTLRGKKLAGEWTLIRMRSSREPGKEQWLILKSGKDVPAVSPEEEDASVLTRRSMAEIAGAKDASWSGKTKKPPQLSNKPRVDARTSRAQQRRGEGEANGEIASVEKSPSALARLYIEPMKCLLVKSLPEGSEWIHEVKFDGVRVLAIKKGKQVALFSRNKKEVAARYPEVAQAAAQLPCHSAILDGEVVALDEQGRSSFQLLQSVNLAGQDKPPLFYYGFDLLRLERDNLMPRPLLERKQALAALLRGTPETIRLSAAIEGDVKTMIKRMKGHGLEGIIAKARNSPYEPGQRSGAWVKFKWTNEQEFMIGGYTQPQGARLYFGAILVGYYAGRDLLFASKVGTGFNTRLLKFLYDKFQKIKTPKCPFVNLPEPPRISGRLGLTASQMKYCTWLKPELVCEVKFSEWTRDNHLRQPVFVGLREDKKAPEVTREEPV